MYVSKKISVLIPAYNEAQRIGYILDELAYLDKYIDEITVVDDGSYDNTSNFIISNYPTVNLITINENLGKVGALRKGLKYINSDYVLLLDADIKDLPLDTLKSIIVSVLSINSTDMVILTQFPTPKLHDLLKLNLLYGGQRIIKKNVLENALKLNISKYTIELALNRIAMDERIETKRYDIKYNHAWKHVKHGKIKGWFLELKAHIMIILEIGLVEFSRQLFFFQPPLLKI